MLKLAKEQATSEGQVCILSTMIQIFYSKFGERYDARHKSFRTPCRIDVANLFALFNTNKKCILYRGILTLNYYIELKNL